MNFAMRPRSIYLFTVALMLTAVALLVGAFSLAVWIDVIWSVLRYGDALGGKATIYVPLLPVATYILYRWSRESWLNWRRSR